MKISIISKINIFIITIILSQFSNIGSCRTLEKCYVSSSEGSDYNDGSLEKPLKSFRKAVSSGADTILIKAGDIFYENIEINGQVVDKYGDGSNPFLCGVKIPEKGSWENGIIKDNKWIAKKSNIWRICLAKDDSYYKGIRTGGSSFLNNAGAVVNLSTDDMNDCRKVPKYSDLLTDFDFWQPCPIENTKDAIPEDFDYLYLYLDKNPNDFNFGISMGTHAVSIKNGEVNNLNIKYWGFGILFQDNVRISNCNIDGIGGFIQRGTQPWVLLGNGIESWITSPGRFNCVVENCIISRTFDCGATIQGGNKKKNLRAENIIFRNNTFKNCCQSFEEFLRGPGEEDLYYNCVFENNISIDAGINTGFRYYDNRYKKCHFLSNSNLRNTNMLIRNNIAYNGNYYCAGACDNQYKQAQWEGNVCFIKRGQDLLGSYQGKRDVIKIPMSNGEYNTLLEATDSAISKYRYLTGDQTTKFIILE